MNKILKYDGVNLTYVSFAPDPDGSVPYELMKELVNGYIEYIVCEPFEKQGINIFACEVGKLVNYGPTAHLMANGKVYDYIAGNFIMTSSDEEGRTLPLTDAQIEYLKEYFKNCNYIDGLPVLKYFEEDEKEAGFLLLDLSRVEDYLNNDIDLDELVVKTNNLKETTRDMLEDFFEARSDYGDPVLELFKYFPKWGSQDSTVINFYTKILQDYNYEVFTSEKDMLEYLYDHLIDYMI